MILRIFYKNVKTFDEIDGPVIGAARGGGGDFGATFRHPSEDAILVIFEAKKPVFLFFLKLLWSCSGIIFSLKRFTFGCIFRSKGPLKSKFYVKFWPFRRAILIIFGAKKLIFCTFSNLLRSCSEAA